MITTARKLAALRWTREAKVPAKVEPMTQIELSSIADRILDSGTPSELRTVDAMALLAEVDRLRSLAHQITRAESRAMMERDQARELLLRVSQEKFTPALVEDIMVALAPWGYL